MALFTPVIRRHSVIPRKRRSPPPPMTWLIQHNPPALALDEFKERAGEVADNTEILGIAALQSLNALGREFCNCVLVAVAGGRGVDANCIDCPLRESCRLRGTDSF